MPTKNEKKPKIHEIPIFSSERAVSRIHLFMGSKKKNPTSPKLLTIFTSIRHQVSSDFHPQFFYLLINVISILHIFFEQKKIRSLSPYCFFTPY